MTNTTDKIIQYPGFYLRIKGDRSGCILKCPGYDNQPVTRKFAADVLRAVNQAVRDYNTNARNRTPGVAA